MVIHFKWNRYLEYILFLNYNSYLDNTKWTLAVNNAQYILNTINYILQVEVLILDWCNYNIYGRIKTTEGICPVF